MKIKKPDLRLTIGQGKKMRNTFYYLVQLIDVLQDRNLPRPIVEQINQGIEELNAFKGSDKRLRKVIRKVISFVFSLLERELKLVPKNYYRNRWMALGIAFGVPLGTLFGYVLGNIGLLGIGIPIGMIIGIGIGNVKDTQTVQAGNQLDIDMLF